MFKIITPPTVEPITLAEVKQQLRIDSTDFGDNITTTQSIPPGSHVIAAAYSLVGASVDVLGQQAVVVLSAGTNGTGGKVDVKIQEADVISTFTDWTGGAFAQVTEATDNATYEIQYTGSKQFIRVVSTVASAACEFGVSIIVSSAASIEDALIEGYITAAREYGEDVTRRAFATQTIEMLLDDFPCDEDIEIDMPPLQSVTSVKYKDSAGTETTLAETTGYLVDIDQSVGRIVLPYGAIWPVFTPYPVNAVRIRCVVGYTTDIPKILKNALMLHVALMWKYRDAGIPDADLNAVRRLYQSRKAGWC